MAQQGQTVQGQTQAIAALTEQVLALPVGDSQDGVSHQYLTAIIQGLFASIGTVAIGGALLWNRWDLQRLSELSETTALIVGSKLITIACLIGFVALPRLSESIKSAIDTERFATARRLYRLGTALVSVSAVLAVIGLYFIRPM